MSTAAKRQARELHKLLRQRFPKAFPPDHERIIPLKIDIHEDIIERLGDDIDRTLLRRALANHTDRAGYLLAVLHHRGDRRYDLDGNPVGIVDDTARAEAAKQLEVIQERQKAQSDKYQTHKKRERELQDAKAKRRAERERRAAEKQQRREEHERNRQRKLKREQQENTRGQRVAKEQPRSGERKSNLQRKPTGGQQQRPYRPDKPALLQPRDPSQAPAPAVVYKKRRRIIPPNGQD